MFVDDHKDSYIFKEALRESVAQRKMHAFVFEEARQVFTL